MTAETKLKEDTTRSGTILLRRLFILMMYVSALSPFGGIYDDC
jgi:hypothetical protein